MDKYTEFAMMQFSKFGKQIEAQAVEDTDNRFDGVTSCMQLYLGVPSIVLQIILTRATSVGLCRGSQVPHCTQYRSPFNP